MIIPARGPAERKPKSNASSCERDRIPASCAKPLSIPEDSRSLRCSGFIAMPSLNADPPIRTCRGSCRARSRRPLPEKISWSAIPLCRTQHAAAASRGLSQSEEFKNPAQLIGRRIPEAGLEVRYPLRRYAQLCGNVALALAGADAHYSKIQGLEFLCAMFHHPASCCTGRRYASHLSAARAHFGRSAELTR